MLASYRQNYIGEFVISETKWSGGRKQQRREWIDNAITNEHISGRAAVIGSTVDEEQFNARVLQAHRGGLLGSKNLQTYGTAEVAKTMRLDFTVDVILENLTSLLASGYDTANIIYTTAKNCLSSPGKFYLIPNNPNLSAPALALYLAAFDGHQEIYLLGYNKETPCAVNNWASQVSEVIKAYSEVTFTLVGIKSNMFQEWIDCANTKSLTYQEFISRCDV